MTWFGDHEAGITDIRSRATPLSKFGLLTAKTTAVLTLILGETMALAGLAVALGWRPQLTQLPAAVAIVLLASAGFSGLALLLAGTTRPESATAVATLAYLLLLTFGGVMFPLPRLGGAELLLPLAALTEGLRTALTSGQQLPIFYWYALGTLAVVPIAAAARWFRWE